MELKSSSSLCLKSQNSITICSHSKTTINKENHFKNCFYCGLFIPKESSCFSINNVNNNKTLIDISSILRLYKKTPKYDIDLEDFQDFYLEKRAETIEFLLKKAKELKFSLNTVYLGVTLMDIIMNQQEISQNYSEKELLLLATMCLFISGKAIELDKNIPFISQLKKICEIEYSDFLIKKFELKILEFLEWDLIIPTFHEIFNFFLLQGIVFSNDKYPENNNSLIFNKNNNNEDLSNFLMKSCPIFIENEPKTESFIENYLEICKKIEENWLTLSELILKDYSFLKYESYKLSVAIIFYLRKISGIEPWNNNLNEMTGIKNKEIMKIYLKLAKNFDDKFLKSQEKKNAKKKAFKNNENIMNVFEEKELKLEKRNSFFQIN